MAWSLSKSKRREVNRNLPEVRMMLATAECYGFNQGTQADRDLIIELAEGFTSTGAVEPRRDVREVALALASETTNGQNPIAVDVAWALASLLSNQECLNLNKQMGPRGVNMAGTFFSDEFPVRIRTAVLGRRVLNWRIPAAYSAVLLISHAEVEGLLEDQ